MIKSHRQIEDSLPTNLALVESFWNRHSFHDEVVESIGRSGGRVIVVLEKHILVLVDAISYHASVDEFPAVWLYHRAAMNGGTATLEIDMEHGKVKVAFRNLRLFRRHDMVVIVLALD